MPENRPTKNERFKNATSFLIVAFVVGTAVVVPGLLALAKKFEWQLPGPLQKLAELIGLG